MRWIALSATLVLTAGLAIWLLAGQPGTNAQTPKAGQPPFVHSVVVFFKKDTPPAKVEALIGDCHKILAKIPSVRSLWAGRPSDKSSGNFVVKDYTVSLMLLFDNYEGLRAYEEDPTHLKFVETYLPVVEKLQVYDFMNQTK